MSKWTRFFIGLGIVGVAIAVYLMFFGVQTYLVWEAHRAAWREPIYWAKPVELSNLSVSKASPKKLSYFGYEFEVPWDDIDTEKTRVHTSGNAIVAFRSGITIWFRSKPPNGLVSMVLNDHNVDQKSLGQLLGNEAAQSDYTLQRAAFEMTPDQLSIFKSRKKAVQEWTLLNMKGALLLKGAESGLYFLTTGEFKGFQYGNPQDSTRHLSIELFRSDGHLDIFFGQKLNAPTTISQADLNLVVQSIHKLPTQE
ncbi:MAG TPA: hypothetical protein VLV89_07595, partial [Candidatus Acidoferrum sp.]|nr:hypothetical protein [Candidatus Acidoferrum sp.]